MVLCSFSLSFLSLVFRLSFCLSVCLRGRMNEMNENENEMKGRN